MKLSDIGFIIKIIPGTILYMSMIVATVIEQSIKDKFYDIKQGVTEI